MKVLIPGGSGQIGQLLARSFKGNGHEVVILTRSPKPSLLGREVFWDAKTLGAWTSEVSEADVVINLAGRSVDCRYTNANRKSIIQSRIDSTKVLGEAITLSSHPPKVWLQAATATIYSHRYDAPNDDVTGTLGGLEPDAPNTWRFSIEVAKAWENALNAANTPNTRKILLRSAMTMSPDKDGVFDVLLGLVRHGLGGTSGDGKQFVSWIHERDFIRAIDWLIAHEDFTGAVNLSAPVPLPNKDFMRELREAWGISFGLPATRWMLEMGAFFMRTETELILKSRRVVPRRLLENGFTFEFSQWPEAANDLCRQWKAQRQTK